MDASVRQSLGKCLIQFTKDNITFNQSVFLSASITFICDENDNKQISIKLSENITHDHLSYAGKSVTSFSISKDSAFKPIKQHKQINSKGSKQNASASLAANDVNIAVSNDDHHLQVVQPPCVTNVLNRDGNIVMPSRISRCTDVQQNGKTNSTAYTEEEIKRVNDYIQSNAHQDNFCASIIGAYGSYNDIPSCVYDYFMIKIPKNGDSSVRQNTKSRHGSSYISDKFYQECLKYNVKRKQSTQPRDLALGIKKRQKLSFDGKIEPVRIRNEHVITKKCALSFDEEPFSKNQNGNEKEREMLVEEKRNQYERFGMLGDESSDISNEVDSATFGLPYKCSTPICKKGLEQKCLIRPENVIKSLETSNCLNPRDKESKEEMQTIGTEKSRNPPLHENMYVKEEKLISGDTCQAVEPITMPEIADKNHNIVQDRAYNGSSNSIIAKKYYKEAFVQCSPRANNELLQCNLNDSGLFGMNLKTSNSMLQINVKEKNRVDCILKSGVLESGKMSTLELQERKDSICRGDFSSASNQINVQCNNKSAIKENVRKKLEFSKCLNITKKERKENDVKSICKKEADIQSYEQNVSEKIPVQVSSGFKIETSLIALEPVSCNDSYRNKDGARYKQIPIVSYAITFAEIEQQTCQCCHGLQVCDTCGNRKICEGWTINLKHNSHSECSLYCLYCHIDKKYSKGYIKLVLTPNKELRMVKMKICDMKTPEQSCTSLDAIGDTPHHASPALQESSKWENLDSADKSVVKGVVREFWEKINKCDFKQLDVCDKTLVSDLFSMMTVVPANDIAPVAPVKNGGDDEMIPYKDKNVNVVSNSVSHKVGTGYEISEGAKLKPAQDKYDSANPVCAKKTPYRKPYLPIPPPPVYQGASRPKRKMYKATNNNHLRIVLPHPPIKEPADHLPSAIPADSSYEQVSSSDVSSGRKLSKTSVECSQLSTGYSGQYGLYVSTKQYISSSGINSHSMSDPANVLAENVHRGKREYSYEENEPPCSGLKRFKNENDS